MLNKYYCLFTGLSFTGLSLSPLIINKINPIRYTNKDNDNLIQLYWTTLK